jgi:hypothetical protein
MIHIIAYHVPGSYSGWYQLAVNGKELPERYVSREDAEKAAEGLKS